MYKILASLRGEMPIQKTRTLRTSLSKEFIHMSQLVLAAVAALALLPVAAHAADDAKPIC